MTKKYYIYIYLYFNHIIINTDEINNLSYIYYILG